ncbi:hypothetical protein AURDEDRAFT_171273 [Auricularia subglabra TFB-10046 SS5]|nr:hypothetical protein AURDEDRAFT_171273 [Auricularia subglabra TFB-10046 SS5]
MSTNNAPGGNQPPQQPSTAPSTGPPVQPAANGGRGGAAASGPTQQPSAGAPGLAVPGAQPPAAGAPLPTFGPSVQPAPAQPVPQGGYVPPAPRATQQPSAAGSAPSVPGAAAQPVAQPALGPAIQQPVLPAGQGVQQLAPAQPGGGPPAGGGVAANTIARCAEALSAFRSGRANRNETIRLILAHLMAGGGQVGNLAPYIEAIVQHEAAVRTAAAVGGAPVQAHPAQGGGGAAPGPQPGPVRLPSPAASEDQPLDAPDDADGDKRPAYNPRAAAFRNAVTTRRVSPHVAQTLDARANYCADLKRAKYDILRDGLAPPFPEDLWEAVLADRTVDFNRILSARYAPHVSDRSTHHIDGADGPTLVFGGPRVTRRVSNRAEWEQCFNDWYAAVVYAYPHRDIELRAYHELVCGLFDSLHLSRHGAILQADIAMRNEVTINHSYSFFDETRLAHVHNRFTNAWGSAVASATPGAESIRQPRRPTTSRADSSGEICNKFNDGHCGFSKCRRLHICRICLRRDHSAKDHADVTRREAEAGAGGRAGGRSGGSN